MKLFSCPFFLRNHEVVKAFSCGRQPTETVVRIAIATKWRQMVTQVGQPPCSFDGGAAERTNGGEGDLECSEKQETPLGKPAVSVHRY